MAPVAEIVTDGGLHRMGEHIEDLRFALGSDIAELEWRLRGAFDVRRQARRHPVVAVTAAAGAGFAVAALATFVWRRVKKRRVERLRHG